MVGAGPVGTSLVRAARGLRARLVGTAPQAPAPAAGAFDSRVYALSPGNLRFLEELGGVPVSVVGVGPAREQSIPVTA